jgi:hypothetical protein
MLCARDGADAANEWARLTLQLYRQSVENPTHFSSQSDWKARFDQSMRELAAFIEHGTLDTHGGHS